MSSAVMDANSLASASITDLTPPGQLIELWQEDRFELILSDHLFAEVERTLAKPYFRARLSPARIADFLQMLKIDATFVPLTETVVGVATHQEDDLVLAMAASARADFLLTATMTFCAWAAFMAR
jgi:putative PIN family toxin of toxin-antitoxin system